MNHDSLLQDIHIYRHRQKKHVGYSYPTDFDFVYKQIYSQNNKQAISINPVSAKITWLFFFQRYDMKKLRWKRLMSFFGPGSSTKDLCKSTVPIDST